MTTSANTNTGLSKKNITASNCSKRLTGKVDMTLIQKSTISPSETHDAISQKIKSILKLLFQQFNKMKKSQYFTENKYIYKKHATHGCI